jgi:hypothetical protein
MAAILGDDRQRLQIKLEWLAETCAVLEHEQAKAKPRPPRPTRASATRDGAQRRRSRRRWRRSTRWRRRATRPSRSELETALRARDRQLDARIAQSLERSGIALMGPAIGASAAAEALETAPPRRSTRRSVPPT